MRDVGIAVVLLAGVFLVAASKAHPAKPTQAPAASANAPATTGAAPAVCATSSANSTASPQTVVAETGSRSRVSSYQVPIDISTKVRVAVALVPMKFGGTEFFKSPNRVAVQVKSLGRGFGGLIQTVESLAAFQVPLKTSAFELDTSQLKTVKNADCSSDYVLTGTMKLAKEDVKAAELKVNTVTYVVDQATLTYAKGGTLAAKFAYKKITDKQKAYYLLSKMTLAAELQSYKGNADIDYGEYKLNPTIPDSVFGH